MHLAAVKITDGFVNGLTDGLIHRCRLKNDFLLLYFCHVFFTFLTCFS